MGDRTHKTDRGVGRRGLTHWELLACWAMVASLGGILFGVVSPDESARRSACINNLRQLGLVLALYANENKDMYPPRDHRPGNLIFSGTIIYPEFLSDVNVLGCPSDPRFEPTKSFRLARVTAWHEGLTVGDAHPDCIDTTSYQYLGHTIQTDDDLRAYAKAWRSRGWSAAPPPAPTAEEALDLPASTMPTGTADFTTLLTTTEHRVPVHWMHSGVERLRELPVGWRETIVDIQDAVPTAGEMPVIWDRPPTQGYDFAHQPPGQNVLFMDGHVEFLTPDYAHKRFPISYYSHQWLGGRVPSPSGDPDDPWGDCP